MNRRTFVAFAAGLASASALARASSNSRIKAIAFDGFVIFDPRPVIGLAESLFPGKGERLVGAWRTRQFEYTWLRNIMGNYVDFGQVTEQALVFACKLEKLELSADKRMQLMRAYEVMTAWPDVLQGLQKLRTAGFRLAFLANLTSSMMSRGISQSGLAGLFEDTMSTDRVGVFKPAPRAYQMGIDGFKLRKKEIAFAAFGGWDAAGASSFGYPTIWVNRMNLPVEELGSKPYVVGRDMQDVLAFVTARAAGI
ncbi:MAG TPA: haloacid dehalogenase type II [Telluria sp.]|nr:haloacid dehalogenase type II [Telluria sp.]